MLKMDSSFENLDNNHQVEEFDFDKRMDSSGAFYDVHNIGGNLKEAVSFDNRIAESDDEWNEFNSADLFTLDEVMQFFEPETFGHLYDEEKAFVMDMFRDKLTEELQLDNPPEVLIADIGDEVTYGYYDPKSNVVVINTSIMKDGDQVRDTMAHEIRHAWQHERADLPEELQTAFDKALKDNFENYISPEDNYRTYRSQLVEMDAREFARGLVEDMHFFSRVGGRFDDKSE